MLALGAAKVDEGVVEALGAPAAVEDWVGEMEGVGVRLWVALGVTEGVGSSEGETLAVAPVERVGVGDAVGEACNLRPSAPPCRGASKGNSRRRRPPAPAPAE